MTAKKVSGKLCWTLEQSSKADALKRWVTHSGRCGPHTLSCFWPLTVFIVLGLIFPANFFLTPRICWQIKEVIAEVRDSNARSILDTMVAELTVREVDPEALAFVSKFAKLTGDYPRLSGTDLKVRIASQQNAVMR